MISELSNVYDALNQGLFESKLPHPVFRIDLSCRMAFRYRGVQSRKITIGKGFVDMPLVRIPDAMLHIMVHVCNFQREVEDCTKNQYHKQPFLELALDKGFVVRKTPSRGWGHTTSFQSDWFGQENDIKHPTPARAARLKEVYCKIKINAQKLADFQEELRVELGNTPKKIFLLKYSCGCLPPHNTIRSGRRPDGPHQLDITCNQCGEKFCSE